MIRFQLYCIEFGSTADAFVARRGVGLQVWRSLPSARKYFATRPRSITKGKVVMVQGRK